MALEIEIDRDACMGSGSCVFAAPGVFELDADSIATVIDPEAASPELVLAAARQCPTGAIAVRQDDATLA